MAGPGGSSASHRELEAARVALTAALEEANIAAVFGAPVDPAACSDYLDVIKHPKDLGTVLEDVNRSLQGEGPYISAEDVYRDVELVWSNCLKYNNRPVDRPIANLARLCSALVAKEWRNAGLDPGAGKASLATGRQGSPDDSSSPPNIQEEPGLPLRLLTDFEVVSAAPSGELRSLDTLAQERASGGAGLAISGSIVEPGGGEGRPTGRSLAAEPVLDWVVQYSDPRCLWVVTAAAWYKLLSPSERYAPTYGAALQAVALVQAAMEEMEGEEGGDIAAAVERIASNLPATDGRRRQAVPREVRDFAIAQVEARLGRRRKRVRGAAKLRKRRDDDTPGGSIAKRSRLAKSASRSRLGTFDGDDGVGAYDWDAVSDDDMPEDFMISDDEDSAAYQGPSKGRRSAWQRIKYWRRRTEEEARQRREAEQRAVREAAADAARGPPPEPARAFRLPARCVPDVLMVWEFTQAFGDVLQLPPYQLSSLEAALDPGCKIREREPHAEPAEAPEPRAAEAAEPVAATPEAADELGPAGEHANGNAALEEDASPQAAEQADGQGAGEAMEQAVAEEPVDDPPVQGVRERPPGEREAAEEAAAPAPVPDAAQPSATVEAPPPPVKRGRGRPRKNPAAAPPPGAAAPAVYAPHDQLKTPWHRKGTKVAPQNVITDPTIKTRRQKGVIPVPRQRSPSPEAPVRVRLKMRTSSGHNPVAAALSAAQAVQDARAAMLSRRYGLTLSAAAALVPLDRAAAAAGILMRDVFCSLMRAAYGSITAGAEQPLSARAASEENNHPLPWPERIANAVWGARDVLPEARAAAVKLAYGDFLDLEPEERVALLAALVNLALNSEAMVAEITARQEQMAATAAQRRDGMFPDEQEDEDGALAAAAVAAVAAAAAPPAAVAAEGDDVSEPPPAPKPASLLEQWQHWAQAQRVGLRRQLGVDLRGRRYWALGGQAGAFRVYCELPGEEGWGWYEGEAIPALSAWLAQSGARVEAPLVVAMRAAPLPLSAPTPAAPARPLVGAEIVSLRADGYRGMTLPLLRGEWNNRKEGAPPPPGDQRLQLAVAALLGAVPFWFKGEAVLQRVLAVLDILATAHYGREAARALLEAERLLSEEGRVSQEWIDLWQAPWKKGVTGLTDMREVPLYTAALQSHVAAAPDLLPRQAFLKYAIEANCPLLFPTPSDSVVVLRAGLLRHVDRYMQLLGVLPLPHHGAPQRRQHGPNEEEEEGGSEDDAWAAAPDSRLGAGGSSAAASVKNEDGSAATLQRHAGGTGGLTTAAALRMAPEVSAAAMPRITADWEALRLRLQALSPVERYTVRTVVYRRHLADEAELDAGDESASPRWPVAWLYLRPARHGPGHQLPAQDLVVPVAIDNSLPDYLVRAEAYAQRTRVLWQPGDRFRMFFGGKISSKTHKKVKTGGLWYKGEVVALVQEQPPPGASLAEKAAYDPWESVVVQWERAAVGDTERVSPWEIEIDPEEEKRRAEDARRQLQAAARAQRARASARHAVNDAEAAEQAAAWEAEDRRLAELTAQADRANRLLEMYNAKADAEEGVFNEDAYGQAAQQVQQAQLAALSAPLLAAQAAKTAAAQPGRQPYTFVAPPRAPLAAALAAPVPSSIPTGPLKRGQEVPQEVLEALRLLTPEQLTTLVTNFYRGLKGKYKIPTFAHKELDLFAVWYEVVTGNKLWKEVCRCLSIDLAGQTSASYNMRLNYERCLLDFENYLACGQYQADVAAGRAPAHTHLTDAATTRFTIPGAYTAPAGAPPSELPAALPSAPKVKLKLKGLQQAASVDGVPALGIAESSQQGAGLAPSSLPGPASNTPSVGGVAACAPLLPTTEEQGGLQPIWAEAAAPLATKPLRFGQRIAGAGQASVGRAVQRSWAEEGGWWPAEVTDFNPDTQEHLLTYNKGQGDESFEWAHLSELQEHELREPDTAVLPQEGNAASSACEPPLKAQGGPAAAVAAQGTEEGGAEPGSAPDPPPSVAAAAAAAAGGDTKMADAAAAGEDAVPQQPVLMGVEAELAASEAAADGDTRGRI